MSYTQTYAGNLWTKERSPTIHHGEVVIIFLAESIVQLMRYGRLRSETKARLGENQR